MNDFHANGYTQLEIFAQCLPGAAGTVSVYHAQTGRCVRRKAGTGFFRRLVWPLESRSRYCVRFAGCEISLAYLCGGEALLDRGVAFLEPCESTGLLRPAAYAALLEEPGRERYHFTAYKNWLNDPNGLCFFGGRYHMYYQYNPHAPQWGNPYWGHAASRDLIHWVHLPVCFEPQRGLRADPLRKGGAFSGSIVVQGGCLVCFFTRHTGPLEDGEKTVEYQVCTESPDGFCFGPERAVVRRPKGYSFHFRDPKVNHEADGWHMFLGSRCDPGPSILHYLSQDGLHWKKQPDLLCDTARRSAATLECPDVFFLDGRWVAIAALMGYTDVQGRQQLTQYYIGGLAAGRLDVSSSGLFDFGSNLYAVQTFAHAGRRIAIGWIADTYGEHRPDLSSVLGSMSLPRELSVKGDRLYIRPVAEVYDLLGPVVFEGAAQPAPFLHIPGNTFYVRVDFQADTDFDLLLGRENDSEIHLLRKEGCTGLCLFGSKTEAISFSAPVAAVSRVEIFVDRRTVEVFLNGGEAAGTKLFYSSSSAGVFSAAFSAPHAVKHLLVRLVKGCAILFP